MYFKSFPSLFYSFTINGKIELRVVTDITANVRLRKEALEAVTIYETYDIKDGETAEIIAAKYYGDSQYHWAVMMINEKYDYIRDFPMAYEVLNEYIRLKYNKFAATSWSYETTTRNKVTTTTVTATIPNHGISLNYADTISVENPFVNQTNAAGFETLTAATGLTGDMVVTGISADTITFRTNGTITGTPSAGFNLYTKNREHLIHHHELNGFTVNSDVVNAQAVTYYQYETQVNDDKRRIKLITPKVMAVIGSELKTLIS